MGQSYNKAKNKYEISIAGNATSYMVKTSKIIPVCHNLVAGGDKARINLFI